MNADFHIKGRTIATERLVLRPFREEDAEDFFTYASVEGVGEMAGWHHHETREETRAVLHSFLEEDKVFAITLRQSDRVIGSLGVERHGLEEKLTEFDGYRGREIGYVLSKDYWGQGIMPEAVTAVIRFLFEEEDLDYLLCGYFAKNSQSRRVQEKCGFKPYRKLTFDTPMKTKEPGVLSLLKNPRKEITFRFSHPETLIYRED